MEVSRLTTEQVTKTHRAEIARLANAFVVEANYPTEKLDDYFFTFWNFVLKSNVGTFYAILDNGRMLGAFGAMFSPDCFSGKMQGAESFWFVDKESRSGKVALKLFNAFEDECDERGCKLRLMIHLAGLNESLEKFYVRRGYAKEEQVFRKVVQ